MKPYKLEFLLCGSPNDAFYAQTAMFRLALDRIGGIYAAARVAMSFDYGEGGTVPERWKPYVRNVDFHYAPLDHFVHVDGEKVPVANNRNHSYTLASPDADLSFACDADTLLLRPFDANFLDEMVASPAIGAVIAHGHPVRVDPHGRNLEHLSISDFWELLATRVLGRKLRLEHQFTIYNQDPCPFYINYGLVAATPRLMCELHKGLLEAEPRVREVLDNWFYGQLGVAMAVELLELPTRVLPMRYNYPNRPEADLRHAGEMEHIHLLHYQDTRIFDRHHIFTTAEAFSKFMSLDLDGSNAIFQRTVRELTGGVYPFPEPAAAA
jgi:hypothetical protein